MTRSQGDRLFFRSLAALPIGAWIGLVLWFAPGWANGWPGLPRRVVWPVGLTAVAFLICMALLAGCAALLCGRLAQRRGWRAWSALAVWSVGGLAVSAGACWWVYQGLSAAAGQLWP